MPNTIDAALTGTELVSSVVTQNAPTLLANFTRFATVGPVEKGKGQLKTHRLPNVTSVAACKVDPADFEPNDVGATVGDFTIAPHHYAQLFFLSNADVQNGATLGTLAEAHFREFCATINGVVVALFTAANYTGTPPFNGAADSFAAGDIGACRTAIKSPLRSLLLSTELYNGIADNLRWNGQEWALPGFRSVQEVSGWAAGVGGAVVDPSAMTVLASVPDTEFRYMPKTFSQKTVPTGCGIDIAITSWANPGLRQVWYGYEVILGASVAQAAGARVLSVA